MRKYIEIDSNDSIVYNINKKKNSYSIFYDVECGLTDDQIHFLLNPNLKDIIIIISRDLVNIQMK